MNKQAFIIYFADRTGKVLIADGISAISSVLSEEDFNKVVKIELIPFEVI